MSTVKQLVYEALGNALEGGYDQRTMDPARVACELIDFCSDLGSCTEEELLPHVQAWQAERACA